MQFKKLSEIAEIKFCSNTPKRAKSQEETTNWLVCANFLADNEVDYSPVANNQAPEKEWLLHAGDIVIKRITPSFVNYIDTVNSDLYCGNNLIIVTPRPSVNGKYLAMVLNEAVGTISKESSVGAVMQSISKGDLEAFEVPLPELQKQLQIGELWFLSVEIKKKKKRLIELENTRTNYLIKKSIHKSGGINNG